jgi:hypothetical protein
MAVRLSDSHTGRAVLRNIFWYLFLLEAESTPRAVVQKEGLDKPKKNSMSSSGLEPATFHLVAQCLSQL